MDITVDKIFSVYHIVRRSSLLRFNKANKVLNALLCNFISFIVCQQKCNSLYYMHDAQVNVTNGNCLKWTNLRNIKVNN